MAKQEECKEGAPEWMATFSDMMTLLLCFFVLLISMSSFEVNKYKDVNSSLKGALGVMVSPENVIIKREIQLSRMSGDKQSRKRAAAMAKKLRKIVAEFKMQNNVIIDLTKTGFGMTLSSPMMFDPGSAKLKEEMKPLLSKLSLMISDMKGIKIRVEGHTDDTPIKSINFPSNWELSSARASAVVRFFEQTGIEPENMSAVGMGAYHPLLPNTSPDNRAKNRRIQIYIDYIH